jgi:hypothetical protein
MPPTMKLIEEGQMIGRKDQMTTQTNSGWEIPHREFLALIKWKCSHVGVSGLKRTRNPLAALGTVPASKDLELHLQVFHVKSNESPVFCKVKGVNVLGVSLGIEAEFSTELVDEFCMNHTLIENWHHERPSVEI